LTLSRASAPLAVLLAATISGCSDSMRALGSTPAQAEAHADQLFEAVNARFTNVEMSPKYDAIRTKLAQAAFVPSRIFDDTSVWEARPSPNVRHAYVIGTAVDGRYRMDTRAALVTPAKPGDSRHLVALEQLGGGTYRWDTKVDMALGTVTAEEFGMLFTALFRAAEGRTEREVRDDYRSSFPRSTAVFGRGFSIDSLRVTPGAAGTTSVTMTVAFHPELMRAAYPGLADYIDKYLGPAKYHFALADKSGVALFDAVGRDRAVTVRYRVQQGKLTSLFGPPRPWADTLQLTSDVSLKVKMFTVGFHNMLMDFVITNSGHDRGWAFIGQHEPNWDLPLITERLIKSPLRRPFEGQGTLFRLSVRDSVGAQTLFTRRTRLDLQENSVMRFLGSLGSRAVGDLDGKVEIDEHKFWHDGFTAMEADLRALAPRWK
jgi:hypothetical protein